MSQRISTKDYQTSRSLNHCVAHPRKVTTGEVKIGNTAESFPYASACSCDLTAVLSDKSTGTNTTLQTLLITGGKRVEATSYLLNNDCVK